MSLRGDEFRPKFLIELNIIYTFLFIICLINFEYLKMYNI